MRCGKIITGLLLLLLVFSCTSTPEDDIKPPEWFLNPPVDNSTYRYFKVSLKASPVKDIENLAGYELYSQVASALGLGEEARQDDLAEFRDEIIGILSGGNVDGFTLIEKDIYESGSERVLYSLVRMENSRFESLKKDLNEILRAGSSASIYTDEAEDFLAGGEIYKAALSYLQAAVESAGSENRFATEMNLKSSIDLFKDMLIEPVESPGVLSVGRNGLFTARLKLRSSSDELNWDNVSIQVTFRDRKKGAVIGDRVAMLRSDKTGLISFVHPSPGFTGTGKVEISLDLLRDIKDLSMLEENFPDDYATLMTAVEAVAIQFNFEIISSAPSVRTGVFIVDSDFLRKPFDSNQTAEGLVSALKSAGFNTDLIVLDKQVLFNRNDGELFRDLPYLIDEEFSRAVFGVAQIVEFDDSAAGFTVVTEARIRVLDLESGEILFDEIMSKRVQGGESQATINTSFKELGKSFSALLMDKLP